VVRFSPSHYGQDAMSQDRGFPCWFSKGFQKSLVTLSTSHYCRFNLVEFLNMASNVFEDLSGTSTPVSSNPYDSLIAASENSSDIQARYTAHRQTRNGQQKAKILDSNFSGWTLDPYLVKLEGPKKEAGYVDPRNCLVFWARPPEKVRSLIAVIQQKLRDFAPNLWLMPPQNLHMTAMEITHSLTRPEIESIVEELQPNLAKITDYTFDHRARVVKPMISYDSAALALSFVPASAESLSGGRTAEDDDYTYHHLRRELFQMCKDVGVTVASRYVVPSAHLTIARFNSQEVFGNEEQVGDVTVPRRETLEAWIRKIEEINDWLKEECWPREGAGIKPGGEWIVGEEKGLDCNKGRLWYGNGERVRLGKGF